MPQSLGKAQSHSIVGLEELVGEMLGKEGKHQVGPLWIWLKLCP